MHSPRKRAQATTKVLVAMMRFCFFLVPEAMFSQDCVNVCVAVGVYIEHCMKRNNVKTIGLSCGPVEKWFAWHFTWTAWQLSHQLGQIQQLHLLCFWKCMTTKNICLCCYSFVYCDFKISSSFSPLRPSKYINTVNTATSSIATTNYHKILIN